MPTVIINNSIQNFEVFNTLPACLSVAVKSMVLSFLVGKSTKEIQTEQDFRHIIGSLTLFFQKSVQKSRTFGIGFETTKNFFAVVIGLSRRDNGIILVR